MIVIRVMSHLICFVHYQFPAFLTRIPVIPACLTQKCVISAKLVWLVNSYRVAARRACVINATWMTVQTCTARCQYQFLNRFVAVTAFFAHWKVWKKYGIRGFIFLYSLYVNHIIIHMPETRKCPECDGTMRYVIDGDTTLIERYECGSCDNTEACWHIIHFFIFTDVKCFIKYPLQQYVWELMRMTLIV